MKKLKIISIGYFNYRNAGDDLLRESIEYLFQDHYLMFTNWFPGIDVLNSADLIIVGGGSIWPDFPFFQFANDIATRLRTPLIIIGISARRKDEIIQDATQKLINKSLLFTVRDKSTQEILNNRKVKLYPDLFWWRPWKTNIKNPTDCSNVALNIREYKIDNWKPEIILDALRKLNYVIKPLPMYFGSAKNDSHVSDNEVALFKGFGFNDIDMSFSTEPIENSKFVVAMRYHAVLMSIRLHRPVISFDYHPKIKSFYQDNNIPELCIPINDPKKLIATIEFLEKNFLYYLDKMESISQNLEKQGLSASNDINNVLLSVAQNPQKKSFLFKVIKSLLSRI